MSKVTEENIEQLANIVSFKKRLESLPKDRWLSVNWLAKSRWDHPVLKIPNEFNEKVLAYINFLVDHSLENHGIVEKPKPSLEDKIKELNRFFVYVRTREFLLSIPKDADYVNWDNAENTIKVCEKEINKFTGGH